MKPKIKIGFFNASISLALFAFTVGLMFFPEILFFKKISHFTAYIMLAFVGLGLGMLTIGKRQLMFSSFICAAFLCLFLKSASNSNIVLPEVNNLPALKIAHVNLGNVSDTYDKLVSVVQNLDIDVISFQEFTPDWNSQIGSKLDSMFKFSEKNVRIDPFGMAIFSSYPIEDTEIFNHNNIPNLLGNIHLEDQKISLACSYVLPLFGNQDVGNTQEHLNTVTEKLNKIENPVLSIGDFNMVYHAKEIMQFRANTLLQNSRRELPVGTLKLPYDHIFYSNDLECTKFSEITDSNQNHIGILGTYQIKQVLSSLTLPSSSNSVNF